MKRIGEESVEEASHRIQRERAMEKVLAHTRAAGPFYISTAGGKLGFYDMFGSRISWNEGFQLAVNTALKLLHESAREG